MQTVHLTEDHVRAYLADFAHRIGNGGSAPEVWVAIGASGSVIGKRLAQVTPQLYDSADDLIVAYDRAKDLVTFPTENNPAELIQNKRILIIDGTVHSGGTLLRVIKEVQALGAAAITSYALAVQRGSKVIPNYFGFLIGDHDRVQFPSLRLANNCLNEYGVYRKLSSDDLNREMIRSGEDFIDKVSWEYRWYELVTDQNRHIYVHEHNGKIAGFVSFKFTSEKAVLIDEVAVDRTHKGKGLGGHLMRWAEHFARHKDCSEIQLWAVDANIEFYRSHGYRQTGDSPLSLSGHQFCMMRKKLLYNLAGEQTLAMGT